MCVVHSSTINVMHTELEENVKRNVIREHRFINWTSEPGDRQIQKSFITRRWYVVD